MKAYIIEIHPTEIQKLKINRNIGICRFVYNLYLAHNKEIYETEKKFVTGFDFSKWLNNEFIPNNPEYDWIKLGSSKSIKKSIMNAEQAFKNFFKNPVAFKYPQFKKKNKSDVKMYLPKNNKTDFLVDRHRVKIPILGYVRLKEKGYLPKNSVIINCRIFTEADKYYANFLVNEFINITSCDGDGIGIDLGISTFMMSSNGMTKCNINKTKAVKCIERKLKREQRKLSRKLKNNSRGSNAKKNILTIQKIHKRLKNIRNNHIAHAVNELVKLKPKYITVENLNVKGMMKNKNLARAVSLQKFYHFNEILYRACKNHGIEFRKVSRFYPSSKTCSGCQNIKKILHLKDRVYKCDICNLSIDRDLNAAINLKNAKEYKIL